MGVVTSQDDTAPKLAGMLAMNVGVLLPVRTTLLQNGFRTRTLGTSVLLPVRTTLLQNGKAMAPSVYMCCYQSGRHCSKTELGKGTCPVGVLLPVRTTLLQNRCRADVAPDAVLLPVRTTLLQNCSSRWTKPPGCCYQSGRHCSKTKAVSARSA